jgi:hypothetical protein
MFKYTKEINKCYDCPNVSNNVIDHDDAFLSTPTNIYWYCNISDKIHIDNVNEISKDCPFQQYYDQYTGRY